MTNSIKSGPSVSVSYAANGSSTRANEFGMRPMQERAFERRGEQYLLIKSPPASGKSRALMFIALEVLSLPLYLMAGLAGCWMVRDNRMRGRAGIAVLPYLLLTVVFVSLGPLLYLVTRGVAEGRQP